MKKTFFKTISLAIVCLLFSCTNEKTSDSTADLSIANSTDVSAFLTAYYGKPFAFGQETTTYDEKTEYTVTEVIVDKDVRARGYVVTDKNGIFIQFADVDRTQFVMTEVDVINNKTFIRDKINTLADYNPTNEFDLIYATQSYNANKPKRPLIGWGDWHATGPCSGGHQTLVRVHYFIVANAYEYNIVNC